MDGWRGRVEEQRAGKSSDDGGGGRGEWKG